MITSKARRRYGRIGGLTTRSRHNPLDYTAAARKTFRESFADVVDPERVLPEAEREARAEAAYRARMAKLADLSAVARAARAHRRLQELGDHDPVSRAETEKAVPASETPGTAEEARRDRDEHPSAA